MVSLRSRSGLHMELFRGQSDTCLLCREDAGDLFLIFVSTSSRHSIIETNIALGKIEQARKTVFKAIVIEGRDQN